MNEDKALKTRELDLQLAQAYLKGDREAGSELYGKYLKDVYRYAFSFSNEANLLTDKDIEDVVGKALNLSVEKLESFNGSSTFKTFLCGFVNNVMQNERRKKITRAENEDSFEEILVDTPSDSGLDITDDKNLSPYRFPPEAILMEKITRQENKEKLAAALRKIGEKNPDYAEILILIFYENLDMRQIAERTGRNYETVRKQYRRAIDLGTKILKGGKQDVNS